MVNDEAAAPEIGIHSLGNDVRGDSFSIPPELLEHIGGVTDLHVMTLHPGHVRGNHYHAKKDELLVVLYHDAWSLHWSHTSGESCSRIFSGSGGATITVPRFLSHAICNDGSVDLVAIGVSPAKFDQLDPDAIHREVVPSDYGKGISNVLSYQ